MPPRPPPATPRDAMHEHPAPLHDTVRRTIRLLRHLGGRVDVLSRDLARDAGAVARDAQAFAASVQSTTTTLRIATPRVARLVQIGSALLARYRWLRLMAAARDTDDLRDDEHRDLARRTAAAAAQLRGGIAKLGQLASCRPDLIGPIWAAELGTLQDGIAPVEAAVIRSRIEAELGRPIAEIFAAFDDAPLAAASLAQVHGATLPDGTAVVVKVQIPGIERIIDADLATLRAIASTLGELPGLDLAMLVDELSRALTTELDYLAEAASLAAFGATDAILPRPILAASSARVLTMTRIDGDRLVARIEAMPADDRDRLLADLVSEIAAQILVRGRVHADPHPGNFLVTREGKLALLDFGCVLELDAAERAAYARLALAIAGADHPAAARELASLGFAASRPEALVEVAASLLGAMRPGAAVSEFGWEAAFATQIAQVRQLGGLAIPRSFVLLGRVLAMVAGLLATYRPRIQLYPLIARHLAAATA